MLESFKFYLAEMTNLSLKMCQNMHYCQNCTENMHYSTEIIYNNHTSWLVGSQSCTAFSPDYYWIHNNKYYYY